MTTHCDVMACAKPFFPGGLKFNVASVKTNHNNEKKYFECVLGCMVRNITGRGTTPDMTVVVHSVAINEFPKRKTNVKKIIAWNDCISFTN